MTYLPSHTFRADPRHPQTCEHPDDGDVCAQPPENPIHALARPDVEALASALAAYPWERILPPHWRAGGCRHRVDGRCGVCAPSEFAIAAAFLDIQEQRAPIAAGLEEAK